MADYKEFFCLVQGELVSTADSRCGAMLVLAGSGLLPCPLQTSNRSSTGQKGFRVSHLFKGGTHKRRGQALGEKGSP